MIVNCLIQKKHYIPSITNKNSIINKTTTQLLLWKLYKLLLSLTLDKNFQFISGVWKNLYKILSISTNQFKFFYLETNKQREIGNQKIEKHLYIFLNYQKDDWADKLPIVKFATNHNNCTSIRFSPFFALKNLYLCISLDIIDFSDIIIYKWINKKKTMDIYKSM